MDLEIASYIDSDNVISHTQIGYYRQNFKLLRFSLSLHMMYFRAARSLEPHTILYLIMLLGTSSQTAARVSPSDSSQFFAEPKQIRLDHALAAFQLRSPTAAVGLMSALGIDTARDLQLLAERDHHWTELMEELQAGGVLLGDRAKISRVMSLKGRAVDATDPRVAFARASPDPDPDPEAAEREHFSAPNSSGRLRLLQVVGDGSDEGLSADALMIAVTAVRAVQTPAGAQRQVPSDVARLAGLRHCIVLWNPKAVGGGYEGRKGAGPPRHEHFCIRVQCVHGGQP